jgi:hypothetical protein
MTKSTRCNNDGTQVIEISASRGCSVVLWIVVASILIYIIFLLAFGGSGGNFFIGIMFFCSLIILVYVFNFPMRRVKLVLMHNSFHIFLQDRPFALFDWEQIDKLIIETGLSKWNREGRSGLIKILTFKHHSIPGANIPSEADSTRLYLNVLLEDDLNMNAIIDRVCSRLIDDARQFNVTIDTHKIHLAKYDRDYNSFVKLEKQFREGTYRRQRRTALILVLTCFPSLTFLLNVIFIHNYINAIGFCIIHVFALSFLLICLNRARR